MTQSTATPAFEYHIRPRAKAGAPIEVRIFGDIGGWDEQSVRAAEFARDFAAIEAPEIVLRINSVGGSVVDGLAIHNAIRRHPAKVTATIEGLAASVASLIAMAADEVHIAANALLMIHAPWATATGNAGDLRDMAETLDQHARAMSESYAAKAGMTASEFLSLYLDGLDHWLTAEEALAAGFVDQIVGHVAIAAHFDHSRFTPPGGMTAMSVQAEKAAEADPINLPTAKASVDEVLARLAERNESLIQARKSYGNRAGMAAVIDRLIADPHITLEAANARILQKLAEDVEPVGGVVTVDENGRTESDAQARRGSILWGDNRHQSNYLAAASDALLIRAGLAPKDTHPAAADLRGHSLLRIAETIVGHQGRTFVGGSPVAIIKAAMTTSDFPLLLADTANKSLMMGYESEPASHRVWTRETEVNDFKPVTRVAISEAPALEEIAEGGEYKSGALSERAESFGIGTYGKMLIISRRAMINDELEAFTRLPQAFGASAARLEADKVYALLTGNPLMSDGVPLFASGHGNLLTGAALSVTSLGGARAAMRKQKGVGGLGVLNVVPRYLIVPASLETEAEQLVASLVDPAKQNEAQNPAWIRSLAVVVDPRLDAASETGWYLAASYAQVDTVEVAHLAGQRGVFVEDETEFTTDNYRIKARLDFAAQAVDWVGLAHNPGA